MICDKCGNYADRKCVLTESKPKNYIYQVYMCDNFQDPTVVKFKSIVKTKLEVVYTGPETLQQGFYGERDHVRDKPEVVNMLRRQGRARKRENG